MTEPLWFQKTMCGSYLKGAPLSIPSFMLHHFGSSGDFLILDDEGVEWPIHVSVNGSRINITSGWCRMVRELQLKEGDVVKLEAIDKQRFKITVDRCSQKLKEPRTTSLKGLLESMEKTTDKDSEGGDSMQGFDDVDEDADDHGVAVQKRVKLEGSGGSSRAAGLHLLVGAASHLETPSKRRCEDTACAPSAQDHAAGPAEGRAKRKHAEHTTQSPATSRGTSSQPPSGPSAARAAAPGIQTYPAKRTNFDPPGAAFPAAATHVPVTPLQEPKPVVLTAAQPSGRAPCDLEAVLAPSASGDNGDASPEPRAMLLGLVCQLDDAAASSLSELMGYYDMLENSVTWYQQLLGDVKCLLATAAGDKAIGERSVSIWLQGRVKAFARNAPGPQ